MKRRLQAVQKPRGHPANKAHPAIPAKEGVDFVDGVDGVDDVDRGRRGQWQSPIPPFPRRACPWLEQGRESSE